MENIEIKKNNKALFDREVLINAFNNLQEEMNEKYGQVKITGEMFLNYLINISYDDQ